MTSELTLRARDNRDARSITHGCTEDNGWDRRLATSVDCSQALNKIPGKFVELIVESWNSKRATRLPGEPPMKFAGRAGRSWASCRARARGLPAEQLVQEPIER